MTCVYSTPWGFLLQMVHKILNSNTEQCAARLGVENGRIVCFLHRKTGFIEGGYVCVSLLIERLLARKCVVDDSRHGCLALGLNPKHYLNLKSM